MIEEVRGPTGDARRPLAPRATPAQPESGPPLTELPNRLRGITGDLEQLLSRLPALEGSGREAVERQISSARIAIQNILSVDAGEPRLPAGLPPPDSLSIDRRNVLQLLDRS